MKAPRQAATFYPTFYPSTKSLASASSAELAPWQARFDFLVFYDADTETGEPRRDAETGEVVYEYVCVGSALEGFVSIGGAEKAPTKVGRDYSMRRLRFNEEERRYQLIAELKARFRDAEAERLEGGTLHRDPRWVARVWRSLEGTETTKKTYDMAEIFDVSRSTINTWLKRALADGELEPRRFVSDQLNRHLSG